MMKKTIALLLVAIAVATLFGGLRIAVCEVIEDDDATGYYLVADCKDELWEFSSWLTFAVGEKVIVVYWTHYTLTPYDDYIVKVSH
jgi:hypothetical protein